MIDVIKTKVKHPVFGHVIFHNLSSRQLDIINQIKEQKKCVHPFDNLQWSGSLVFCNKCETTINKENRSNL